MFDPRALDLKNGAIKFYPFLGKGVVFTAQNLPAQISIYGSRSSLEMEVPMKDT